MNGGTLFDARSPSGPPRVLTSEQRARVALSRLAEPGDPKLGAYVSAMGPEAVVASVHAGDFPDATLLGGMRGRLSRLDVDGELAALHAVGGRVLFPGDDEWPMQVDDLGDRAPWVLWVRGAAHLATAVDEAVAIVGTRAASSYGIDIATILAAELAERQWTIVSGGAYGIDACAHRGALAIGGTTIAVLACGVDVPYPRGHAGLFDAISERGAVVSELPPRSAPHRMRFLERNRLIAALGAGTVMVEAAARSGARRTANEASDLGRAVMAVPGPVTADTSVGCHRLLREDPTSVLVTCSADVLELVGRIGVDLAPVPRGELRPRDSLSPDLARVLDAVPVHRAQGPARIATTAGLPLGPVETALGLLLLYGFVEATGGGWRLSEAARKPAAPEPDDVPQLRQSGETHEPDTPVNPGGT